jgi:hypothetical protein
MTEDMTMTDALNVLHNRIAEEIGTRTEFNARNVAADLIEKWNTDAPGFLDSVKDRLIENEIMRQVNDIARERRSQAMVRLRQNAAAQRKFELVRSTGKMLESRASGRTARENEQAVLNAAHSLMDQTVTVSKSKRIRLGLCTQDDLSFLVTNCQQRSKSFGRQALFYSALLNKVVANGGGTVEDLPETELLSLTEVLHDEENN